MAQVSFRPQQPMVVDSFKNCEGLCALPSSTATRPSCLGRSSRSLRRLICRPRRRARRRSKLLLPGGATSGAAADVSEPPATRRECALLEVSRAAAGHVLYPWRGHLLILASLGHMMRERTHVGVDLSPSIER